MSKQFANNVRARFTESISRSENDIPLAEAALLIAAEEYPRLDVALYLEKLERLGDRVRERAAQAQNALEVLACLNTSLFDELGFQGNRENYYDPRNSFLNEVIDRRIGIPITLSVVYIEVARQSGFALHGIGLPGHFIVGYLQPPENLFIDVFNGGRLLGENALADLVAGMSGGKLAFHPSQLLPVTKKQIITRMLANLLGIYSGSQDYSRAVATIERILILMPESLAHQRDYGLLLAQLGKTSKAIEQLETYLQQMPEATDAETITEQIKKLKQARARLN
ncbi:MAG: transglutaminase family protein [Acidobacteria bacterium]|nr:transglutaminase family protein [Acidobacteriota bacterium]